MAFNNFKGKGISLFSFFLFVILFLPLISSVKNLNIGIDSNPQPIINNNDSTGLNIGIDSGKINYYHYGNISVTNVGGSGGGNITSYVNIALTNQSATWVAGTNVSTGIGGWFKGRFNWIVSILTPSSFATFNGTTLWINTTYFYNMTTAGGSGFNATYDTHINNLTQHNSTYWYNQTYSGSTYNATYAQWAYNQTSASGEGVYVKKAGDVMTGNLRMSTGTYVISNTSGSYTGWTDEDKWVNVYKEKT